MDVEMLIFRTLYTPINFEIQLYVICEVCVFEIQMEDYTMFNYVSVIEVIMINKLN